MNKSFKNKTILLLVFLLFVLLCASTALFSYLKSEGQKILKGQVCKCKLEQISFYIRIYLDKYRTFPVFDGRENKQRWSWRVCFPYLRNEWLVNIDKPDDEIIITSNIKYLSYFEKSFACSEDSADTFNNTSCYVAVMGPGTLWTETNRGRVKDPYKYGDMILVIETTEPKNYWAEPGDDVSPEDVIRLFQADPGLVKNSKQSMFSTEHWPKYFMTLNNRCCSFDEIKNVEELKRRLVIPEEELLPLPDEKNSSILPNK